MIFEYIKLSINELFNNKLRTFLSLIGIVIGVAVVYIIFSISDIANVAITSNVNGNNGAVNINYLNDKTNPDEVFYASLSSSEGYGSNGGYKFNLDYLEELKKIENITDVLPHYSSSQKITIDRKMVDINVKRNSDNFVSFYNLNIIYGKNINDYPENERQNLAVVSDKILKNSFKISPDKAVGKTIKLKNRLFTIAGVSSSTNSNVNTMMLISKEAYDSMFSRGTIQYASIKIAPGADIKETTKLAVDKLNELNGTLNSKNGYAEEDLSFIINQIKQITGILSIVMSVIASISLLVAGIGVMNIMLVSVVERTREIGVKRALGASKGAIQFQFIVESSLLTLLGGIFGVLIGIGVIAIALQLLKMDMPINLTYIMYAVVFSISLGVIFGFLPAKRAANLNIIEAIQSE
ncbi:MAG: ABC transporter permease [Erysipelotrichaceae bacterium]|nr:ABC transporter permease [Erysipelotrichaceae bacterium]